MPPRLSGLQRFALIESYSRRRARLPRQLVHAFYKSMPKQPKEVQDVVTKSLESLIDRGLLIGYGRRTPKKWFIDEIRLTAAGRKLARRLLGEQLRLPLKS
ncbi:MAG: hypothetical protein HY567_03720 [Candidatus Kerfeldbacteria bacterium]|nr:hypothetical protein [Candidatus Kerfeldbacteria bacterium]